jgi:site-specific recombinase XerD
MRAYAAHLERSTLQKPSQRAYLSAVRGYMHWLETVGISDDPLDDARWRDVAVRQYGTWLQSTAKRSPQTLNKTMAALDNFYSWRGMGACGVERADIPHRALRILVSDDFQRYLSSALALRSARDRAICLLPLYTGAQISDVTALDIDDVEITLDDNGTQGVIRLYNSREISRVVPVHRELLPSIAAWHAVRSSQSRADSSAFFTSRRGSRMSADSLSDIIRGTAGAVDLADVTPNVLRHTFEANLAAQQVKPSIISYLLGRARQKGMPSDFDILNVIAGLPALEESVQPAEPSPVDPATALATYKASHNITERLAAANPADADWQHDLAASHSRIGSLESRAGDTAAARASYQSALNIFTRLANDDPTNQLWLREVRTVSERMKDLSRDTDL